MIKSTNSKIEKKAAPKKKVKTKNLESATIIAKKDLTKIKEQGFEWVNEMRELLKIKKVVWKSVKEKTKLVQEIGILLNKIEKLIQEDKFIEVSQHLAEFNKQYLNYFKV